MTTALAESVMHPVLCKALDELAQDLVEVGLTLSVQASDGESLVECDGKSEACWRLCHANSSCLASRSEGIKEVWSDGQPRVLTGNAGCMVLAVPVQVRRRTVAVAVACYLPSDLSVSERFALACDKLSLDRTYMASVIAGAVTHPACEAEHWMRMLQIAISQAITNAVSKNELSSFTNSLGSTYEELSLLYRLSGAMNVNADAEEFFQRICLEMQEVIGTRAAVAILTDTGDGNHGREVLRVGPLDLTDAQLESLAEAVHQANQLQGGDGGIVLNQLPKDLGRKHPQIANLVAAPLVAGDKAMGMLMAIDKIDDEFDSADLKLIHSIGVQAAVFLANNHLYDELQELLMGVLHVLTASIDAKDEYTCGHSQRVALISRKLAEMYGFDRVRVEDVYLSGLLHDIGKIGVPESVLCKPGKLSDDEFTTMKRHPVIGANILSNIRQMKRVLPGVLYHHERIDGRGYPEALAGDEVPIDGRIVGLADCFDAMTSSRTYREALPVLNQAQQQLQAAANVPRLEIPIPGPYSPIGRLPQNDVRRPPGVR